VRASALRQRPDCDAAEHRGAEIAALRVGARALVENLAFADTARAIVESCRMAVGAGCGFLARRTPGPPCLELTVPAPAVPGGAARESAVAALLHEGWPTVLRGIASCTPRQSVLLAPIVVERDVAGVLGLTDKPGGFSSADAELTEAFAELAAVALARSAALAAGDRDRVALREVTLALTRSLDREIVLASRLDARRDLPPSARPRPLPDGRAFGDGPATRGATDSAAPRREALTRRELDVLALLVRGNTNRESAGVLGLSTRTVENHRANLMAKLGLASRVELVRYAEACGLL
jgi:DNA-binding CsgD family transcriptional regulator